MPDRLPAPAADALAHSRALSQVLVERIGAGGGFMPFDEFMQAALYEPGYGYYVGAGVKFGGAGDFVTAPEISPLYGRTLARQVAAILRASVPEVLELGAGTGRLARDLLAELARLGATPACYRILEVSAELRARQSATLAELPAAVRERVTWIDHLPGSLRGAIVGNEVLDALPVSVLMRTASGWRECGVAVDATGGLCWANRPLPAALATALQDRLARLGGLAPGYMTEFNLRAEALVETLAARLDHGVALFVDYGFPEAEYYHPERSTGTLFAHYRHRAHDGVLAWPGLQDITAHVDFSALARAARRGGAALLGYTTQARFLLNCGITELLDSSPDDPAAWLVQTNQLGRLVSEAEMGELFKVFAFGSAALAPLDGFATSDRSAALYEP